MNCGESREYMFAFLDNELETPLSIELQRHLDGCADCAREAEIERTVHRKLSQGMFIPVPECPDLRDVTGPGVSDANADGDMAKQVPPPSYGNMPVRWHRAVPIAAGLTIVTGLALWYSQAPGRLPTSHVSLVELAVADFAHFLDEGGKPQIRAHERREVEAWLARKTGLPIQLPRRMEATPTLIGGRKCTLNGRPAAFAVYRIRNAPVSLVAVDVDDATLQDMTKIDRDDEVFFVGRQGEYRVAARRRGGLVYAAVSTLPETELFCLLTETSYESH